MDFKSLALNFDFSVNEFFFLDEKRVLSIIMIFINSPRGVELLIPYTNLIELLNTISRVIYLLLNTSAIPYS